LKSIFTDLELNGDAMIQGNLCKKCLYCQKICPVQALSEDADDKFAVVNQAVCLEHEKRLQQAYCDPCGSCIKVCPVGEDRQLFQSNDFDKYFSEQKILAQNPNAKEYKDWVHIRSFGSYPLKNGYGDTKLK
jgi:epoxyqueuosine reductase QueG